MLLSVSALGIAIDVAIVALIAIFALIGLRKGFFKSVISMISTLVVLIISILCASPFARLINKMYDFTGLIAGKLCKGIASMGPFYNTPIEADVSGAEIIKRIPESTNGFLKKLMSHVLKPLSAEEIQGETVANIVSGAFASIIMIIICGILLFILIKIILIKIDVDNGDACGRDLYFKIALHGLLSVLVYVVKLSLCRFHPAGRKNREIRHRFCV